MDLRNLRLFPGRYGLISKEFDVWNTNEENDQTDPATEFTLDLGYSNQYEDQILHSDIGVGANAVDAAFVTTDSLSDLVWSPHEGLSLKCDDKDISSGSDECNIGASIIRPKHIIEKGIGKEIDSRAGLGKLTVRKDDALASDIHVQGGCQASASLPQNQNLSASRTLEKRESTAENELQNINAEYSCHEPSEIKALELLRHQPGEMLESVGDCVEADRSPSHSRIHKKRKKDKEKALSDGHVNDRNSNNKDDNNYESVESCAGISSNGKKRWNEQQLAVKNKRVKNQNHGADGSTYFKGQDSSFMNWIANMIKAFPNSILEKESSLALTLAHSDNEPDGSNKELVVWKKSRDKQRPSTGFSSIFQSLHVDPSTKGLHGLTHDTYYETYDANATPLAFHRENNISCGQVLATKEKLNKSKSGNENFNESVLGSGADALRWPNMLCFDHSSCHENQMTVSGGRKVACGPLITIGKDINGTSSSSSSFMANLLRNNTENIDSDVWTGVKTSPGLGNGEDHLNSLWITRLSVKTSCSAVNLDSEDQTSEKPS